MRLLVEHERTRLAVWLRPRVGAGARLGEGSLNGLSEAVWRRHCEAAARNNPAVLLALVARFPSPHLLGSATRHVTTNPEAYCHLPEAVDLYLNEEVLRSGYPALGLFTNCTIVQALCFLDKSYTTRYPQISAYALRSLCPKRVKVLYFISHKSYNYFLVMHRAVSLSSSVRCARRVICLRISCFGPCGRKGRGELKWQDDAHNLLLMWKKDLLPNGGRFTMGSFLLLKRSSPCRVK
ncbi:putative phosphatidylinositol 4-kinase alpha [Trypanosoma cruzi]|uniref:Putative phosphatidylinositol 4-kinase alpha n=1 Tax=Trypanosoma cruzi TaxID=5693 RepID=A0A2V2WW74_TRYCR|nr:putative phosphatidylinositol 4-kinase alpha [Trypanosoma cruzi]